MWLFGKKITLAESGILAGGTDCHSHILPGVDDGVENMEEALRILATFETAGIKELWLTPHIMEDIPNTPGKLRQRFEELQAVYNGSIALHLAAEYMIDNNMRELLSILTGNKLNSREHLLPIGSKGNHLLVETSYYNPPIRLHETLKQIKSLGFHPLLAHPERYMYMDKDEYRELHEEGIRFQLNLPSICGAYGNTVKKRAEWLLKEGLYHVVGSDTHCEEGVEFLLSSKPEKKYISTLHTLKSKAIL